jgi:hypothetical protein
VACGRVPGSIFGQRSYLQCVNMDLNTALNFYNNNNNQNRALLRRLRRQQNRLADFTGRGVVGVLRNSRSARRRLNRRLRGLPARTGRRNRRNRVLVPVPPTQQALNAQRRVNVQRALAVNNQPSPGGLGFSQIRSQGNTGNVIVSQEEIWIPNIKNGVVRRIFNPGSSGLTRLDQFSTLYEEYKVVNCLVRYITGVGTTRDGRIIIGCDFEPGDAVSSYADVSIEEPHCRSAVWENMNMVVPVDKIMKGKTWLACRTSEPSEQGFALDVAVDGDADITYGEVWVRWTVEFSSPTNGKQDVATSSDVLATVEVPLDTDNLPVAQVESFSNDVEAASEPVVSGGILPQAEFRVQAKELPVGQDFAVSFEEQAVIIRGSPHVSFKYADGTELAPGTISELGVQRANGFWSTLWQIAKPLLKTLVITLIESAVVAPVAGTPPFIAVLSRRPPSALPRRFPSDFWRVSEGVVGVADGNQYHLSGNRGSFGITGGPGVSFDLTYQNNTPVRPGTLFVLTANQTSGAWHAPDNMAPFVTVMDRADAASVVLTNPAEIAKGTTVLHWAAGPSAAFSLLVVGHASTPLPPLPSLEDRLAVLERRLRSTLKVTELEEESLL